MSNAAFPGRRSIRRAGWDYAGPSWYFITINTAAWRDTLAKLDRGRFRLTAAGQLVRETWERIGHHSHATKTDAFVVMPNHIHGILHITLPCRTLRGASVDAPRSPNVPAGSLGAVVRSFKSQATRRIREDDPRVRRVWHRNYHERIIGNANALESVRRYIAENPEKWIAAHGGPAPEPRMPRQGSV